MRTYVRSRGLPPDLGRRTEQRRRAGVTRTNEWKLPRSTIAELDGRNDLSVRQIADVAHALGMEPAITLRPQPARRV